MTRAWSADVLWCGLKRRPYVLYSRLAGVKVSTPLWNLGNLICVFFFCLGNGCFHLCKEGIWIKEKTLRSNISLDILSFIYHKTCCKIGFCIQLFCFKPVWYIWFSSYQMKEMKTYLFTPYLSCSVPEWKIPRQLWNFSPWRT